MQRALLALGILASSLAAPAGAVPIRWVFQDAVFDDGGTLVGSFVYDADTNVYSQIDIATTAGTAFGGASYVADIVVFRSPTFLGPVVMATGDLTGTTSLSLFFYPSPQVTGPGLTNAGGVVPLLALPQPFNGSRENDCRNADCQNSFGFRGIVAGSVVGTPVPEPGPLGLFLAGGAAVALGRRGRRWTRASSTSTRSRSATWRTSSTSSGAAARASA